MRRFNSPWIAALCFTAAASAQPRRVATVMRVERLDARAARSALEVHREAIERCLTDARRRDPTPLMRLRTFEATITVARDGTASSVEFSPPLYARGLSACMAETLLGWRQAPPRTAGVVHVRVVVPTTTRRQ